MIIRFIYGYLPILSAVYGVLIGAFFDLSSVLLGIAIGGFLTIPLIFYLNNRDDVVEVVTDVLKFCTLFYITPLMITSTVVHIFKTLG